MKQLLYILFAINTLCCNTAKSQTLYTPEDSLYIERLLTKHCNTQNTVIEIARSFIGVPYAGGTLDLHNNEQLTINTRELDCTTFVETVAALVVTIKNNKKDFTSFCDNLRMIRYRNGKCNSYADRLHYISQWITDKGKNGMIGEITTEAHKAVQKLKLNYMSNHPNSYRQLKESPKLIEEIKKNESPFNDIDIKYISKDLLNNSHALKEIRDGDIIAVVTAIEGLDVSHMGFATWEKGKLHMIHASSSANKVIKDMQSLYDYMHTKKKHLGIRIFRIE